MNNIDLSTITEEEWLEPLHPYEKKIFNQLKKSDLSDLDNYLNIAKFWLSDTKNERYTFEFGTNNKNNFFQNFQKEINKFICGNNKNKKEYQKACELFIKLGSRGLIDYTSILISTHIGTSKVILVPIVALFFNTIRKMGVNAYCAMINY